MLCLHIDHESSTPSSAGAAHSISRKMSWWPMVPDSIFCPRRFELFFHVFLQIPGLTKSHSIALVQEELLIVSRRTSFRVSLHLYLH